MMMSLSPSPLTSPAVQTELPSWAPTWWCSSLFVWGGAEGEPHAGGLDSLADRVVIHDELGTNSSYTWPLLIEENEGDVDKAFSEAAFTVSERYVQQRLIPMAMETRAVVAVPQPFVTARKVAVAGPAGDGVFHALVG